jgi:AMMECR1 domain-containing protein
VPLEWGWDRIAFLDHTCEKASLPVGAWRDSETRPLGFTAEVFGEERALDPEPLDQRRC